MPICLIQSVQLELNPSVRVREAFATDLVRDARDLQPHLQGVKLNQPWSYLSTNLSLWLTNQSCCLSSLAYPCKPWQIRWLWIFNEVNSVVCNLKQLFFAAGKIQMIRMSIPDERVGKQAWQRFKGNHAKITFQGRTPLRQKVCSLPLEWGKEIALKSTFRIERKMVQPEHAMGVTCHKFPQKTCDF